MKSPREFLMSDEDIDRQVLVLGGKILSKPRAENSKYKLVREVIPEPTSLDELCQKHDLGHEYLGCTCEVTDTERLEWLIKNEEKVVSDERGYFTFYSGAPGFFKSPREAIDASMKRELKNG